MNFLSKVNLPITICSLLLISIGTLVIYSSSRELAIQQAIFAFFGFLIYFFISQFDYRSIKNLVLPFYIFVTVLLVVVIIIGAETRGVIRWIPLGIINIQPSELAKPALILMLALFWANNKPSWLNIFKSLLWTTPIAIFIFKQPDLGSTLTILAIWITMIFASAVSYKKIFIVSLTFLLIIPLSWSALHDYQKQRITSFLAPESDPLGKGYNLIQSEIAVGSGQIFGRGLGRGTQSRLQFLPEFRTDFIFAAIAEEMGFLGSSMILSLYLFLIVYILRVSTHPYDRFGSLIIFGVCAMILFQTVVNIGMNIRLLPITGITLPLISYGGSSLIATLFCLGFVSSVAKLRKRR